MLLQNKDGMCGTFAVANALLPFKVEIDLKTIAKAAGTTVKDGTSKRGIIRAIQYYGMKATPYESYSMESAWKWITKWASICTIVVLIDNRQHYATCIGRFRNKIILSDPSCPDDEYENNVLVLGRSEFIKRWEWNNRFYAIRVS